MWARLHVRGCRLMRVLSVQGGVTLGLELERGVLNIEMAADACLHPVEISGSVPVMGESSDDSNGIGSRAYT